MWLTTTASATVQRFPRPDFSSGYIVPGTSVPAPQAPWWEWLNILVLVAALYLAGRIVFRYRSRLGMWLLTLFCLGWFGFWRHGCICPVGSIQNMAQAWADPSYAIPLTVILLFALPLIWTLFAGRTFCGGVCPLGAVQELVLWRPVKIPVWLGHVLGLIPWMVLGVTVLFVTTGAGFLVCRWDPFVGLFRLGAPFHMAIVGAVVIGASMFVGRPFCRFICPYGAVLGAMSSCSKRHVTITPSQCVQCRLCEDACPYGAIRKPVQATTPEARSRALRRLAFILVLMPLVIVIAAVAGRASGRLLSQRHPRVALAMQMDDTAMHKTEYLSPEQEAFMTAGPALDALRLEAQNLQSRFATGGMILGIWLALVVSIKLIALSVWRPRTDYEPDRVHCFSCARCFSYCPVPRT
jgi:ferredoxin